MITVLGDRVLVALPPHDEEIITDAGLVLVKDPDRFYTPTRGIVMQIGTKHGQVELDDVVAILDSEEMAGRIVDDDAVLETIRAMLPAPFDVQVGDCVVFGLSAGDKISLDGIDYVVLHESDIIGIVEPIKEAA